MNTVPREAGQDRHSIESVAQGTVTDSDFDFCSCTQNLKLVIF